ncbi:MAG TPA: TIGR02301 family protein [Vitreimonas sp.]|uniref:TIGR02301 family protein n=1 Tax=Vitreimonas sp. TaxID=3069702 RepID=UPI002D334E2E|nr:TIGR02301 family protein [Vitreimonas sp.]HYD87316.1 TIGR02301 family protein [Vitreimonas sp.]
MRIREAVCAVLLAAFIAAPAAAQPQAQPLPAEPLAPQRGEEWYSGQLIELSEILGGSHFLRILCEGRDDQRWRDYMRGVISREPEYNALLVEGFNRGYRNEEARFDRCDDAARQMEAELRARGLRVAQGLSARHAN